MVGREGEKRIDDNSIRLSPTINPLPTTEKRFAGEEGWPT
jgi:hypothetical protein